MRSAIVVHMLVVAEVNWRPSLSFSFFHGRSVVPLSLLTSHPSVPRIAVCCCVPLCPWSAPMRPLSTGALSLPESPHGRSLLSSHIVTLRAVCVLLCVVVVFSPFFAIVSLFASSPASLLYSLHSFPSSLRLLLSLCHRCVHFSSFPFSSLLSLTSLHLSASLSPCSSTSFLFLICFFVLLFHLQLRVVWCRVVESAALKLRAEDPNGRCTPKS